MLVKIITKYWALFLACLIFSILSLHYLAEAPVYAGDSLRYLNAATEWLNFGSISGKAANYRGYVLFVAGIQYLFGMETDGLLALTYAQTIVLGMSLICLYDIGLRLHSPFAAGVTVLLFAANYYAARWVPFILTKSLFTAMVIISCWVCLASIKKPVWLFIVLPVIAVTAFTRPNGLIMLPLFIGFLILQHTGIVRISLVVICAAVVALLVTFIPNDLERTASQESLLTQFENGNVIYGVESVPMPKLANASGSTLLDVSRYVFTYPLESSVLVSKRLFASWSWYRQSYSFKHQIFLGSVIPMLYILALVWLFKGNANRRIGFYLPLIIIGAQTAVIGISFANHDHRFINYIMPLVFVYAGVGMAVLWKSVYLRVTSYQSR